MNNDTSKTSQLKIREKIAYGMGAFTESTAQNAVAMMMLPIFNIMLGVNPAWLGCAAAITRAWDAFSDPMMGYISDNTRSRWGRRKPYILAGAIATAATFAGLWLLPAGLDHKIYFAYFLVMSLLYYTSTTVYCVPYISMGYELSDNYHERTSLMGYRMFFVGISGIGIGWMLRFTQLSCFEDGLHGMRVLGILTGIIFIIFAIGPLLVKEKVMPSPVAGTTEKVTLRDSLGVFKVKPFIFLLLALCIGTVCTSTPGAMGMYIVIYHVAEGNLSFGSELTGYTGTTAGILAIVCIPAVNFISRRIGKKFTLILFLLLGIAGLGGSWWLYTPAMPYLSIIVGSLGAVCMSALYQLLFAMVADVCEYDKLVNHKDRAGTFAAVLSWGIKFGIMAALAMSGFVLNFTGFDADLQQQMPETIFRMRFIYATVPAAGFIVSALLIAMFPISAAKLKSLQQQDKGDL